MFIKVQNLSKKYGEETLFSRVNLMFTDSNKVGLIGKNGVGKTTFLKILAGKLKPDSGTVEIDPKKARTVYHKQVLEESKVMVVKSEVPETDEDVWYDAEDSLNQNFTAFEYLMSQKPELFNVWTQINSERGDLDYPLLIQEYSEKGGYQFEDKINKAVKLLKLPADQDIRTLSGGQKTRLQFGILLIEDHDILLLDEPTNHLDIDGIEWFYKYIENYKGVVIIATHDRNLLNRSINKIIEFEYKELKEYSGNYEYYQKEKRTQFASAQNKIRVNERRVEKLNEAAKDLENRLKRHENASKAWDMKAKRITRLTKKNKSAKTKIIQKKLALYKDNDKLTRNFKLDRQAVKLKASRSLLLTKADRINTFREPIGWNMRIDFKTPTIQSDFVLRVRNLSVTFNEKSVLKDFNLEVMKNQKVALVGPNGAGKTTLLRAVAGEIQDFSGEVILSPSIKRGYLDQENLSLNYNASVISEFLSVVGDRLTEGEARSFLHFFLFENDMPLRKVETLSEGEKLKLKLAKLLYSETNFLLLDEPTNHLDIASQEVIEKALKDFQGSIILVTHDEMLRKNIGVTKVVKL